MSDLQALPNPPSLDDLRRVHSMVKRQLPAYLDREDIAVGILIESSLNGHSRPSYHFVRNRCIDVLRKLETERSTIALQPLEPAYVHEDESAQQDNIDYLVGVLSPTEKRLVWYRFFRDPPLSVSAIAQVIKMPVPSVQGILAQALFKMRQAGQGIQH